MVAIAPGVFVNEALLAGLHLVPMKTRQSGGGVSNDK